VDQYLRDVGGLARIALRKLRSSEMTSMKKVGLALLAVCAVSAISVSSASASLFLAHPNSGTFPLLILALAQGSQLFHVPAAGNVECNHFKGHGVAEALRTLQQLLTFSYSGCTAFGLTATVNTLKYLFSADGLASLENTVEIKALGCTITIASSKNQNLEKLLYLNTGNDILIHSDLNGITSFGTGVSCAYAEESGGTFRGLALGFADGGSVHWDP
jgi:hypothetical protein